jgi:hypothetical protein
MDKLHLKELKKLKLNSFIKKISLLSIVLLGMYQANAQMECRSMIGAHLKPISKKIPISWAIEGTMAPGFMTSPWEEKENAKLNGGMLLGALEFNLSDKSNIYIEGGYKNWKNSALVAQDNQKKRNLGVRQFFYSYAANNTKVKLGLHETRLGKFFLVDERVLGSSIDHEEGAFNINLRGATVMKNFARMGQFCSNRHLYGVIHPNYTEKIGKKIGDTNMAGLVINWNPHYKKPTVSQDEDEFQDSGDEFQDSSDEFQDSGDEFIDSNDPNHENHEFGEFKEDTNLKTNKVVLTNVALILYDEFGNEEFIPENKFYAGSLIDVSFPYDFFFQTGAVYQSMKDNNSVAYIAKIGRNVTWKDASNTKLSAGYIGKYNVDDDALFQPVFSNLFLGEIMRMDAVDFPLWQATVKHRFPGKLKFHIALKGVGQLEAGKTNEQNIEAGILLFKNHLKMTLIGSHVNTELLPKDFYTTRLEMRLAF